MHFNIMEKIWTEFIFFIGISTDADVQSNDLIEINRIIKEKKVPAVFVESTINPKIMQGIQSENKIKIGGKLFADSLGDEHSEGSTYINMIKHNTDVIVSALSTDELFNSDSNNATNSKWIIPFLIVFYIVSIISLILINKNKNEYYHSDQWNLCSLWS